jgi:hypothetical protein
MFMLEAVEIHSSSWLMKPEKRALHSKMLSIQENGAAGYVRFWHCGSSDQSARRRSNLLRLQFQFSVGIERGEKKT